MCFECYEELAFLRVLSRDVMTAIAPDELPSFDKLYEKFFAILSQRHLLPKDRARRLPVGAGKSLFAPVVPAAVMVGLNYLEVSFRESTCVGTQEIRAGLKRLLMHGAKAPGEGIKLKDPENHLPERLKIVVYANLCPIGAVISTQCLFEQIEDTSRCYGLEPEQGALLGNAVLRRFCRFAQRG